MRIMGLDVGNRRIGVAVSDIAGWLAQGRTVVQRTTLERDLDKLKSIIEEEEVGEVVVGLPLSLDGSESAQCEITREFGGHLAGVIDIPLVYWDERLTTVQAEKMMELAGVRKDKRKEKLDVAAATILLQGYLDSKQLPRPSLEE